MRYEPRALFGDSSSKKSAKKKASSSSVNSGDVTCLPNVGDLQAEMAGCDDVASKGLVAADPRLVLNISAVLFYSIDSVVVIPKLETRWEYPCRLG